MGLLDQVVGALGGAQGGGHGGGQAELIHAVIGMLGSGSGSQSGGLGELVARFQQGGLGDVVSSWISTGQNLPISADQLSSVLGQDAIAGLAQKTGLPAGDLTSQLTQMLPQIIDGLTPNGQLPQGGLGDIGSLLGGLLRR
mgnify:CR=1 FL=1|jgi:uncharacterized protein YidB (DUF937 family)